MGRVIHSKIAVIDTMIVRDFFGWPRPSVWLSGFRNAAMNGLDVAIHDVTLMELLKWIESNSIEPNAVKKGVDALQGVLSPTVPFVGSGSDFCKLVGVRRKGASIEPNSIEEIFEGRRRYLEQLAISGDPGSIRRGLDAENSNDVLKACIDEHRDTFSSLAEVIDEQTQRAANPIEPVSKVENYLESDDGVSVNLKYDLPFKLFKEYGFQMTQGPSPLNPYSKKRKNDGPDLEVLNCVALPAWVVTSDKNWLSRAREASSFQSDWVISPDAFLQKWSEGTLPRLSWPIDTAIADKEEAPA